MKKKNIILIIILVNILWISILSIFKVIHPVTPNADEEAVLIDKPWFFGHEGVREKAVTPGLKWVWITTEYIYFKTVPTRYDVVFDDIKSNNNTPLDYATYITLQIESGKSPLLLQNYGQNWFSNIVEATYRNFVRDEVSKYNSFDLMSNREICAQIDNDVRKEMEQYFKELNSKATFPVICTSVITGRANPNKEQLDEMNRTAAAIQARETQDRKAEMEKARANAETQKAIADKAYMVKMGLTTEQFITLKIIEKSNPNIDILMGGGTASMWNIRR